MPKLNDRSLRETHKSTKVHKCVSTCLPCFGTLFGLTKDEAEIVLVEIVLLNMLKKNTRVFSQGLNDICAISTTNDLQLSTEKV